MARKNSNRLNEEHEDMVEEIDPSSPRHKYMGDDVLAVYPIIDGLMQYSFGWKTSKDSRIMGMK